MKPKRGRSSYVLLAGMMGLLIVGAWIAYQVYSSLTKTQITAEQAAAIRPLDGRIQSDVLENLAGRRKFSQADLASLLVFNISEAGPSTQSAEGLVGPSQ